MEQNILEKILEGSEKPTNLPLETLRKITEEFSIDRIIGEGGFATVYKGVIGNWDVAVKKTKSIMTIDQKLFRREVSSLMEINHPNVVRFLGLCSHTVETPMKNPDSKGYIFAEKRERLLCFEFISNGSLDKKIADELRGLDWDKRFQIIKGICAGLHYLHKEKFILHMDLKPGNILLDKQMMPKITDFGLSRPTENSQTTATTHFASLGYTAPENMFGHGRMSVKSDMYSLGVIIIELVTGDKSIPDNKNNILRRWRHRWNKSMKETPHEYHQQVTKCIEIGSLCQKTDPHARPSVSEIMEFFVEMESTNNQMVGQVSLPNWEDDLLGVDPLELQFAYNMNKQILSCSVELTNNTDFKIAFDIQTTSPLPYSIAPNKDIVKPRSRCSVDITLSANNKRDHKTSSWYGTNNKQYGEVFTVRSAKVDEGFTAKDIVQDMFDKHAVGHHVDEIQLRVVSEESCNEEVVDFHGEQAKKQNPTSDGSSEQLTTTHINDEDPINASLNSGMRTTRISPGTVQLAIKNTRTAPLLEYNKRVMLELTGGDCTSDRPGLDLVVVVDVTCMQGEEIEQLKTAMRIAVQKLSPMDSLSVITLDCGAITLLCSLWKITEASQQKLQELIYKLEPQSAHGSRIMSGLRMGLDVLASREVRAGRVGGIILMSEGNQRDDDDIPDVRNVPVYTFCFGSGSSRSNPVVLNTIAAKSMGGTFSHVLDQNTGSLTMALSQCLVGLLTVAVQNLELTVEAIDGESKIVKVTAGSYPQGQHGNNPAGSVTISFGNLYSKEVRKVIVDLFLPTIYSECSAEILDVTYSHNSSAGRMKLVAPSGRMKLVAPTETLTVWRTGGEFSEEKPAGLQTEEARLKMAWMIREARYMAECKRLEDAQDKLVEAHQMVEEQQSASLLQELVELLNTQETYETQGRPYALSLESYHDRQRLAWPGGDMRLVRTPRRFGRWAWMSGARGRKIKTLAYFISNLLLCLKTVVDDPPFQLTSLKTLTVLGAMMGFIYTAQELDREWSRVFKMVALLLKTCTDNLRARWKTSDDEGIREDVERDSFHGTEAGVAGSQTFVQ